MEYTPADRRYAVDYAPTDRSRTVEYAPADRSRVKRRCFAPCPARQEREAFLKFGAELSLCGPLTGHSARFLYHSGLLHLHIFTAQIRSQRTLTCGFSCSTASHILFIVRRYAPSPRLSLLSKHIIERIQIIAVVIRQRKVFCKASVKLFSVPYPSDIYFEFHIPHTFRSDSDRTTFLPDSSGPSLYGYRFTAFTKNRRGYKHPTPPHTKVQKTRSDRLCSRSVRPMNK